MKPQKIYAEVLDDNARAQFDSVMAQDYVVQGALMADAHLGYGMPIGGVAATEGMIVPSWVGYDIGCGMCACPTTFNVSGVMQYSKQIFDAIYDRVPVGFNKRDKILPSLLDSRDLSLRAQLAFLSRGGFSDLGTLGSGNHFIEIGYDTDETVWIIIHSGSRGVGHGVAGVYMGAAQEFSDDPAGHHPLPVNSALGKDYINDMNWMLAFALENRMGILDSTVVAIQTKIVGGSLRSKLINRNHNHAEEKDGLWIHRKGATHAEAGMMGVIPGNMRDGSFIVRGLGNPDSLCSSSHGAGRVLGRNQAKKTLSMDAFKQTMTGVQAKVCEGTLDESPEAYKNIFDVMQLQGDLVQRIHHIKPIINIKG